jgi:hypothetical protein
MGSGAMVDSQADDPTQDARDRHPILHFGEGFRIAIQFPQLLLATLGMLVLGLGQAAINRLPFAPDDAETACAWEKPLLPADGRDAGELLVRLFGAAYRSVSEPAVGLLRLEQEWTTAARNWTHLLWALAVWAFFGAAITRLAAINFAVDRTASLKSTVRFAGRRFLSFFTAPLLPVAGIAFLWLVLLLGGLIGSIPTAGPFLAGIFWFLALAVGFVAALILVGVLGGWPLMAPTISTEDSDAFDGFSRSFSYFFSRTRQWGMLILAGAVYGIVLTAIVLGLACLVVHLAVWGVAAGMGLADAKALTAGSPFSTGSAESADVPEMAANVARFWLNAASLVVHGSAASLFWSLSTISYFLLRQADDATSLDEVFLNPEDEPDDLLPLVGAAASEQPIIERPLEKDAGAE